MHAAPSVPPHLPRPCPQSGLRLRRYARGLSLVELVVALVLASLMALAAFAALLVARQGFTANTSAEHMREDARFVASVIERVAEQAGFQPWLGTTPNNDLAHDAMSCPIFGRRANGTTASDAQRPENCASLVGIPTASGSEVLEVRARTGLGPGSETLNCDGRVTDQPNTVFFNRFSVETDADGAPALFCYVGQIGGSAAPSRILMARNVEHLRALYGVAAGTDAAPTMQYKRADQMSVTDWRKIRTLRVGLIVRGAQGSAGPAEPASTDFHPLGPVVGEPITISADGRLRLVHTFTVQLYNPMRH